MLELCVGKSMPNICRLALVRTTKKYSSLMIGDVICFKGHDKNYYVHRIINHRKYLVHYNYFVQIVIG